MSKSLCHVTDASGTCLPKVPTYLHVPLGHPGLKPPADLNHEAQNLGVNYLLCVVIYHSRGRHYISIEGRVSPKT